MINVISELGRALSSRWKAKGYAEWEFPSIAAGVLEEFNLVQSVDRIFDHVFVDSEDLPLRDHGAPEVANLYATAHFNIYLHVWLNGLAPLHHHDWSGAYQLLRGSSLNAHYAFTEEHRLTAGFSLGQLQCLAINDLSAGDVRLVEPGPRNIHTLSYNEPVSLTISIRSRSIPGETSKEYWRPGVATEMAQSPDYMRTRGKCIQYLASAAPRELLRRLRDLVSTGDLPSIFLALQALHRLPTRLSTDDWHELLRTGEAIHGPMFEKIALAGRDCGRPLYHRRLLRILDSESDDGIRRFLSNLFVCPDRQAVLARVLPTTADIGLVDHCRAWCRRIVKIELGNGDNILDGLEDGLLAVLDGLLSTGSVEATMTDIMSRYEVDEETVPLVREACEHLRSHAALGTLFLPG